jgi:hypothetical protein
MKIVNDIVSDLIEKKLWWVAALLVIAIVAVPMQLAKPGDPPPAPSVPNAIVTGDTGPELALTRASKTGFGRAPRVNEKQLDPFAERTDTQAKAVLAAERKTLLESLKNAVDASSGSGGSGDTTTGGSGDTGTGDVPKSPTTDDPKPTSPKDTEKPEVDDLLSLFVTVGDGAPKQMTDVRTLSPLPDASNPFLVYTGKSGSGAAVFIVSADVQPSGEGTCEPSPENCVTLTLAEGQTEDFKILTGGSGTVSITVIGIETKEVVTTATAARATRLEAKARKLGAGVVRKGLDNPFILQSLVDHKIKIRS